MLFNPIDHENAFYALMIQTIIPRPIAWILSKNPNGTHNLAPFSFFNGITSEPPIIAVSVGWKDDTTRKDTWVNIEERQDFVLHIPSVPHGAEVVKTAAALPLNTSEIEAGGLAVIEEKGWPLPRLKESRVAMLCVKHKIIEVGQEKQGLILGEIKKLWVDDSLVTEKGGRFIIPPEKLDPLSRLGGKNYAGLGKVFEVERPK